MNISIIIPLLNEEESLGELCVWIAKVMEENNYTYEVFLIDDGILVANPLHAPGESREYDPRNMEVS